MPAHASSTLPSAAPADLRRCAPAGGIPKSASLVPEADSHWQPPLPRASPGPPSGPASLGQVSGVAKGHNGTLWVLHRGTRVWDGATFEGGGAGERTTYTDAIDEDTVLQLDQDTGAPLACSAML